MPSNGTIELKLLLLFSFALNVWVYHQYKLIEQSSTRMAHVENKSNLKTRQKVYYSVVHFKRKLDRDVDNSYS